MVGGFAGRDLERVVHLVPRQRDHALGEIDKGENVPVGRGPSPEQPLCLADPVGGLVEATKTNEDHGFRGKAKIVPREANAFGQVKVVEGTPQSGLPITGQHVDDREQAALEDLDVRVRLPAGPGEDLSSAAARAAARSPQHRWTADNGRSNASATSGDSRSRAR